jgi:GAF domain-containing protein
MDADLDLPLAEELAAVFARLSGLLLSAETVSTALALVSALATEVIPGTDGAGVTLLSEHGEPTTAAASNPLVSTTDDLQYALDEGPCLTAWRCRVVVRVDDVAQETRWPRWVAAATKTGVRSVVSVPLVAGGDALGALKVYAYRPDTYGDRDEYLLTMFAAQAAVLVANVRSYTDAKRVSDDLKAAVRARDLVNMAKGILMDREAIDERTAFLLLIAMARDQHETIHELASGLTNSTSRRLR